MTKEGSADLVPPAERHDEAQPERACGPANGLPDTPFGRFPASLMQEVVHKGWRVISIKDDWKRVFAFEE